MKGNHGQRALLLGREGMPGSDSGPRQGWLESAQALQTVAFPDHPVLDSVSATPPRPRRGVKNAWVHRSRVVAINFEFRLFSPFLR